MTQGLRGRREGETTRTCSRTRFYVHPRIHMYIHARTARAYMRASRTRRGKEKGRSCEIYLPEFRWSPPSPPAVAAPLSKNASRIRDLSRNMSYGGFPRGDSPRVFDRCFSAVALKSFNARFVLKNDVEDERKYSKIFRDSCLKNVTRMPSEFRDASSARPVFSLNS